MKLTLGLMLLVASIVAFSAASQAPEADRPMVTKTWTNQSEQVVSILSAQAVSGVCPECGAPNHHLREIRLVKISNHVLAQVVFHGHTNEVVLSSEPDIRTEVRTNITFAPIRQRTQPGWNSIPPLPASTNN